MSLLEQLKERNRQFSEPTVTDPAFYDSAMDNTIAELNQAGISLMDYPPSTRHRAFILEGEITKAANDNQPDEFNKLLKDWRNCFN